MEKEQEVFVTLNATQGTKEMFSSMDEGKQLDALKSKLREFFDLKNVNFLFGSGTSDGAIPTMKGLFETLEFDAKTEVDIQSLFEQIKNKCNNSLEACLSVMYAARNYFNGIEENEEVKEKIAQYTKLIKKVEKHIYDSINNIDLANEKHADVFDYYKTFYQKLALRAKENSRIRVFTTNNDLFNEMALDSLNIHYINGFTVGLKRFFIPALFNYTWSKRMDTSIDKYEPVENLVYLYKLHGSVNWRETKESYNSYFEIVEVDPKEPKEDEPVLIYPTPTKQDKSLGSPYLELFREFQNKLLEPHSVLFVIGYSFSDRHVNDIIYRALATNSTLNVVIFGRKPEEEEKKDKPIFFIDDNRIFTISGKIYQDEEKTKLIRTINHFDYIVKELLPNIDAYRKDDVVTKFVEQLNNFKKDEDR